jgi:hypothetical protein
MDYTSYLFGWFSGLIVGISLGAYIDRELTRIKWNNTVNETIKALQTPVVKTFIEIICRYYDIHHYFEERGYPTRNPCVSPFASSRPTTPQTSTPQTSTPQTSTPQTSTPQTSTPQTPQTPQPPQTSTPQPPQISTPTDEPSSTGFINPSIDSNSSDFLPFRQMIPTM